MEFYDQVQATHGRSLTARAAADKTLIRNLGLIERIYRAAMADRQMMALSSALAAGGLTRS